ncbi:uncharacterized protein LOC123554855 [Mercenaria mercenaria]|uniref:uncharacterized protein LOC123554855 n=1 Tax=Mercenaria mercenaria TaxID=6596 RepID=UPI00234E8E74|nr:uncharacterized protein LOC123554855 [Mercenaria mercenaria]XP_045201157.2 uncharacterized protein LOC123554855 [Mercenaria mercenaria]
MSAQPPKMNSSISVTSLNADAIPRCSTHRKRLKFFCSKHELLLCSVCAVKRHRSCEEVLTITEACEDKRSEGNKLLDMYNQKVAVIENAIVERKAAKKLLDTNAQEIQTEIHEITEKLIDLVRHEERTLLETVDTMQGRESETLEKDISGLEETCEEIRKAQDALSQSLKFSDVDLIHAVIKEKQKSDDEKEVETIVKKRFKEIDFKFVISPHITSFLKHFKNLGQVMMSEDSGNPVRVPRSNMSTPVNELPSPIPRNRRENINEVRQQHSPPDESHMSAREKWIRDRQRQMQMQTQNRGDSTSSNNSVFLSDQPSPVSQTRRNQPMRALPMTRPETPEVYSRPYNQTPRREFVPRPMSTPPVETPVYGQSPKSRDVNRFNSNTRYRSVRPEPVYVSERRSPVPIRSPQQGQPHEIVVANGRQDIHHVEPVHVFQRRATSDSQSSSTERSPSPWSNRAQSPPQQHSPPTQQPAYSIVSVKDSDTNFGRSFAAVQINDPRMPQNNEHASLHAYQSKATINIATPRNRDTSPPNNGVNAVFSVYPNSNRRTGVPKTNEYSPRLDESRGFSPSGSMMNSMATDEEKVSRWVHQTSFTSNGIGSKRLISGVGVLYDGRVVLVDQEHYTVQLYDRNFRFVSDLKLDSRPFDVAVISENKIVVSLQSDRVLKFILITGEGLTAVADLGVPCEMVCYGVCRGGGNYCVCCGDEVWILSDDGRVVNRLKTDKPGNPLFVQAEYVSIDSTGNVLFISDAGSNKILAIQVDGRRLWEFTYQGFKPSGLKCVDMYIYVCDRDQHRVLMLDMDGQVVKQSIIGRLENPRALCFHNAATHLIVTQMRYDAIVSPPRPIHVYTLQ